MVHEQTFPHGLEIRVFDPEGDARPVPVAEFLSAAMATLRCVRIVARHEAFADPGEFVVSELHRGSACLRIGPPPERAEAGQRVLDRCRETFRALATGTTPPVPLAARELEAFERIVRPRGAARRRIGVAIDQIRLGDAYAESVASRDLPLRRSRGNVSGRIERLDERARREFDLFPPVSDAAVRCRYPADLRGLVLEAIRDRATVTVTGTKWTRAGSPLPSKVDVTAIRIHDAPGKLPTARDLLGLFGPDATGGLSAEAFVRKLRDE